MLNEASFASDLTAHLDEQLRPRVSPALVPRWFGFLSDISETLFNLPEGTAPWESLLAKCIPALADWCVLSLATPGDTVHFITRHRDDVAAAPLIAFAPSEGWLSNRGSLPGVEWRTAVAREQSKRVPSVIGLTSYISIPLIFRNQYLGRLTLAMSTNRSGFGESDLQFVRELGLRIALAVDNARLRSEARRAAEIREEMMAVVSHDLKNPLTAILVSASLLHDRARTPDEIQNAKMRRLAESIRHSAERMNGLIGAILDVAKLSAGRMALRIEPVNAGVLTDEIYSRFLPQAIQKNIFLERDVQQSDASFACDREKVEQALSNLMTNAIRFTPQDGRITLRVRQTRDAGIEFAVSDTGPGIPCDRLRSLFDRVSPLKESIRSGTGLGLFIAKGLIELHGGIMWVESLEGSGSTFYFTLPR